jgi:hypothetical protein
MSQGELQPASIVLSSIRMSISLGTSAAIALGSSLGLVGLTQSGNSSELPTVNSGSSVESQPTSTPQSATPTQIRFTCELNNGQYTVMYHPESRPSEAFPWATPSTLGGGWTPERRCNEISRRLEEYRPDGLLEMQTSQENSYNIVCVTTQRNSSCRIVFTVPPGQDPLATRNSVFQNLSIADSGQSTQAVNTFADAGNDPLGGLVNLGLSILGNGSNASSVESQDAIKLKPFLDPADGGTGTALKGGIPSRANLRLNPNNFR